MKDKILIVLSTILLIAVGIEGYYLYQMNKQITNKSSYYQPIVQKNRNQITNKDILKQINPNIAINPFKEFQRMQEEMNRVFGNFNAEFQNDPDFEKFFQGFSVSPAMDMRDAGDKYIITVEIPGSKKSSIKVDVKNHILKVVAKIEKTSDNKNPNYIQKERYVGNFEREITLPNDADVNSLKTKYDNGLLTITILKKGSR